MAAQNKAPATVCRLCGKGISNKKPGRRYCGRACFNSATRSIGLVLDGDRDCKRCNKPFKICAKNQQYCSEACKFPPRLCACGCGEQLKNGYWSAEWRPGHGTRKGQYKPCVICGTVFWAQPASHNRECCSMICRNKRKKETTKGKRNPAWKGGHVDNRGWNWEAQRAAALLRDNFTCRMCGMLETESLVGIMRRGLDVHHKIPYLSCIKSLKNVC